MEVIKESSYDLYCYHVLKSREIINCAKNEIKPKHVGTHAG